MIPPEIALLKTNTPSTHARQKERERRRGREKAVVCQFIGQANLNPGKKLSSVPKSTTELWGKPGGPGPNIFAWGKDRQMSLGEYQAGRADNLAVPGRDSPSQLATPEPLQSLRKGVSFSALISRLVGQA